MTPFRPAAPIPGSALVLGLAGLIPFAAAALTVWLLPEQRHVAQTAGLAYGATALSFLGGIRWGTAIGPYSPSRIARELTLSAGPPLAGWIALLLPPLPGLCLLIAGFLLQALWDVIAVEQGRLPGWFGRLRMMLTAGTLVALLAMTGRLLT